MPLARSAFLCRVPAPGPGTFPQAARAGIADADITITTGDSESRLPEPGALALFGIGIAFPARLSRKSFALGFFAIGMLYAPHSARAEAFPSISNANFLAYTGSAPKDSFTNVAPTGWIGGNGYVYVDTPGINPGNPNTACGAIPVQTYGCPSTLFIQGGYNFVEADGNPYLEGAFDYVVTGLNPGTTYQLGFYQAASQAVPYNGNTTEQWVVSLGTSQLTACPGCVAGGGSTYSNADANASTTLTSLMSTPSDGMTNWQYVSINLTADATTDLLSFLAWGDGGSTANIPPIVFLAGLDEPDGLVTPEPGTVALVTAGLFGLGLVAVRRRRKDTD